MQILLAEDEQEEQKKLKKLLTSLGHEVVAVGGVDEATAALVNKGPFAAVITDMRMPFPDDGMNLLQWLQTNPLPTYAHSSDNWHPVPGDQISLTAMIPKMFPFAEFNIKDAQTTDNIRVFLERVEAGRQ